MPPRAFTPVCLIALALAQGAAAQAQPVRPPGDHRPLGDERLSDEQTVTRWANPNLRSQVLRRPDQSAPVLARLHLTTEDGLPEVYLVLRSRRDADGRIWLEVRVPMRPNGRKGWVRRDALGSLHTVTTRLRVSRGALRATLYRSGRRIWSSRIGVGKPSTPTPGGRFWIRERLRSLGRMYGPWAFGTSAYSVLSDWPGGGVVGIHGTDEPQLLPGRVSHGCIRVPNAALDRLAHLMPTGTPVLIS
jgi:hypothetical protein